VHDLVPIFSGHDSEQSDDPVSCGFEVGLSGNAFAKLDRSKQDHSHQSVEEDEQEHSHDNEKALVHGHSDCEHQHLQGRVFAGNGEEAQNHHNEAERVADLVTQPNVQKHPTHTLNDQGLQRSKKG
jgi:hypothetical protein